MQPQSHSTFTSHTPHLALAHKSHDGIHSHFQTFGYEKNHPTRSKTGRLLFFTCASGLTPICAESFFEAKLSGDQTDGMGRQCRKPEYVDRGEAESFSFLSVQSA